ncbi:low affinity iron permease family protein [Paraburkholderia sp. DGU8]|jgi:low affinity Fe/Cu permease|uniref:low affinity iron permease family protein n=1 Tax=Paraburkholderia sp. DGU8 TaxID=3161997 RepID=UPI00346754EF
MREDENRAYAHSLGTGAHAAADAASGLAHSHSGTRDVTRAFDAFACSVTRVAGSPVAFGIAAMTVLLWAVTGPLFHFSDCWQLVINTGTTIITFLMVFLIQQSQNKDSAAVHLKLNELLASHRAANNQLIGIEDASEDDLRRLAAAYLRLAGKAADCAERVDVDACIEEPSTSHR